MPVRREQLLSLRADCGNCFGLCCVAPAFSASADFAIDKDAAQACPNLESDFRCGIHRRLRVAGYRGCTVYDCFGAGQKVSQVTFGGQDWRRRPDHATQMFEVFAVMRQLHELLWYLAQAMTLDGARPIHADLRAAFEETERITDEGPDSLMARDLAPRRDDVNALLVRASELVRGGGQDHRGADLIGADLTATDLRCANLRGACLIAADLRGADLSTADVTGADFRDTDLSGADLSETIFLTQSQLDAAKGDGDTRVPASLTPPVHWCAREAAVALIARPTRVT